MDDHEPDRRLEPVGQRKDTIHVVCTAPNKQGFDISKGDLALERV